MLKDIRLIEIEINGFCNRICSWCPNSFIDRTKTNRLPEELYLNLLKQLSKDGYDKTISFSRYNEPMADIDYFAFCTRLAKSTLPNVKLVSNTNGDFITKENLDKIFIDELTIMDYDGLGMDKCKARLKKVGAEIIHTTLEYIRAKYKNIDILYLIDWCKNYKIDNRGGSINRDIYYTDKGEMKPAKISWNGDRNKRTYPCNEPQYFIGIDYNGNVMPCCNLRSDNKDHSLYVIGNIKHMTLNQILNSLSSFYFKDVMSSELYEYYFVPCVRCHKKSGRYTRENPGIEY